MSLFPQPLCTGLVDLLCGSCVLTRLFPKSVIPKGGCAHRKADDVRCVFCRAYHRAKLQGLVALDLSPNEIGDDEQPFGFTLATRGEIYPTQNTPTTVPFDAAEPLDFRHGMEPPTVSFQRNSTQSITLECIIRRATSTAHPRVRIRIGSWRIGLTP